MDGDIEELFESLIKKYREQDAAFDELKLMMDEYEEWCAAMGCSEKKGFGVFYQEYIEGDDSIWDSIFPNKEEYDGYDS